MIFISLLYFSRRSHYSLSPARLSHHNITTGAELIQCGNSTEEAKSHNCQYDILMNSWIPAPCIDQDAIDEYLDDNSWAAFRDESMTQRLMTIEEISETEVYYTSARDHINHCAMLWKKQFWVLYTERHAIDAITANPIHTDHCATVLSEAMDIDPKQATKVEKGYAGCWLRKRN
ncbi:hypothetical protein K3495_g12641 [Podosphaera aphanis]|nr:hypothetical protein K3495_g12641 [Podosphaera aphanis]